MKVTYNGPHDAVEIAETGQLAERGNPIEVTDDLGKRLCEQDTWSKPTTAQTKKEG